MIIVIITIFVVVAAAFVIVGLKCRLFRVEILKNLNSCSRSSLRRMQRFSIGFYFRSASVLWRMKKNTYCWK